MTCVFDESGVMHNDRTTNYVYARLEGLWIRATRHSFFVTVCTGFLACAIHSPGLESMWLVVAQLTLD